MTNDELLHKWVEGTITEEELEIFKSRPEYPSLVELYKNTESLSAPDFEKEAVLFDILSQPKNKLRIEKTGRRVFLSSWMKYAVAAVLVLMAGFFLWQYNQVDVVNGTSYTMAAGESMEALLPDESIFYLNAESELSYDEKNWETNRTLSLKGEAFFEVKKGSTFTVETPHGKVQVLGTKFNVWSRNKLLEVKCQSGKVAVYDVDGNKIDELNPSDAIRISSGKAPEKWTDSSVASWREGISKFRDVPLEIVLEELERQYDVEVKTGSINTEDIISCNFQHENLELALKTILSPLNIKYAIIDEKTVTLSQ
jgi:ferric-dicitrate binding protein FerR (iron transport regulator)